MTLFFAIYDLKTHLWGSSQKKVNMPPWGEGRGGEGVRQTFKSDRMPPRDKNKEKYVDFVIFQKTFFSICLA